MDRTNPQGNESFLSHFIGLLIGFTVIGTIAYVLIIYGWLKVNPTIWLPIILGYLTLIAVAFLANENSTSNLIKSHNEQVGFLAQKAEESEIGRKQAKDDEHLWRQTLIERASGFPTLLSLIQNYEGLRDASLANLLVIKKHPAIKSSEVIREQSRLRRIAEYERQRFQGLIEYYEHIAPFLLEFREEIFDDSIDDSLVLGSYTEEEWEDHSTRFLKKEEYRRLSCVERDQLALDRYWNRPIVSKRELGKRYERYVGYLYEKEGYKVDYVGIMEGYEDLGRDLICKNGNRIDIVQCKNWSQFKTIHEKHIFQLFGTVWQYRNKISQFPVDFFGPPEIRSVFFTSTSLSDIARRFANEMSIQLREDVKMDSNYPCIKCNISYVDRSRIYHLPFDQQYDKTKIDSTRGEFYCSSVATAVKAGFRRALRYHGNADKSISN